MYTIIDLSARCAQARKACFLAFFGFLIGTYSVAHAQALWTAAAHPEKLQVNGVAFSSDDATVLSGTDCHPSYLRLFDRHTGNVTWDHQDGDDLMCMLSVGFSAAGNRFAAAEEMGNVVVFDYNHGQPQEYTRFALGTDAAFALDFSRTADLLAVGASSGELLLYSVDNKQLLHTVKAHANYVTAVCFNPKNNTLVTGGDDAMIHQWDSSGAMLSMFMGHTESINALVYSPDGSRLYSSANDNTIRVWDVASGSLLTTISIDHIANALDVSPDGSTLVAACAGGVVESWSTSNFTRHPTLNVDATADVRCLHFSHDGSSLVCGTSAGLVLMYSADAVSAVQDNGIDTKTTPNEAQRLCADAPTIAQLILQQLGIPGDAELELSSMLGTDKHLHSPELGVALSALPEGTYLIRCRQHMPWIVSLVKP